MNISKKIANQIDKDFKKLCNSKNKRGLSFNDSYKLMIPLGEVISFWSKTVKKLKK